MHLHEIISAEQLQFVSWPACIVSIDNGEVILMNENWKWIHQKGGKVETAKAILNAVNDLVNQNTHFGKCEGGEIEILAIRTGESQALIVANSSQLEWQAYREVSLTLSLLCDMQGSILAADDFTQRFFEALCSPGSMQTLHSCFNSAFTDAFGEGVSKPDQSGQRFSFSCDDETLGSLEASGTLLEKSQQVLLTVRTCGEALMRRMTSLHDRAGLTEEINRLLKLELQKHKQTQEQLTQAKSFLNTILDSSLNMVITLDAQLNIVECNRTAEKALGYSRKKLIGRHFEDLMGEKSDFDTLKSDVLAQGEYQTETLILNKKGKPVEVLLSVSPLLTDKGKMLGYVCSMRDITESKAKTRQLELTEALYTDLFENASDLIQGLDSNGNLLYANTTWKSCLGYAEHELDSLSFLNIVHPALKEEYQTYLESVFSGGEVQTRTWMLHSKIGRTVLVESKDNLKLQNGKPHSLRSIMRDVTMATESDRIAQEQQAKIQAIFNSGSIMFWTVNEKTSLTSFNDEYANTVFRIYGEYPQINKDLTKPKHRFATDQYHEFWDKKYREVFTTGEKAYFQTKTIEKGGRTSYREIYLNPIWSGSERSKVREVAGMAIDITDKKQAERKINEQASKIRAIFEATNQMIWSVDSDLRITSFNRTFAEKLWDSFNFKLSIGVSALEISERFQKGSKDDWHLRYHKVLQGDKQQFEHHFTDANFKEHVHEVIMNPIYDNEGQIHEVASIAQSVTYKRAAENRLKSQAAKITAIFENTAMLIWTMDTEMRIVSFNTRFAKEYFEMLRQELGIGTNFVKCIAEHLSEKGREDLLRYMKLAIAGQQQQFEGAIYTRSGAKRWMEVFINPIYSDEGKVRELSCMSYEITDKKEIEEQMRNTISEKEVLLQEVHHRVKNNLQVISSILNLQSSYVKDENSLSILRESQNRIKSMSFIHESLYQNKDFSRVEFSDYILTLSRNLIHSYSIEYGKVDLQSDFTKVYLSLDQAIPCGLIVNEVLSNALKYAFPEGESGKIYMKITEENNQVYLEIADNGVGLPPGLDIQKADSLGLQLIFTLVEQLDASIEVDTQGGTKYLFTFEKH